MVWSILTKLLPTCKNRRFIFRTMLCTFRCAQGSVLGPLLFVVFINDLSDFFQSATPFKYADDTKLLQAIRSVEDTASLQSDINSTSDWSTSTDLLFMESKFIHLCYFSATVLTNHPIYTINGNFIKCLSQHTDLGVIFSSDLSWSAHYNAISTKAYQTLGLVRWTFKINCIESKETAVLSTQLLHCSQLWRPQLIRDIKILEHIQWRATKNILNDYFFSYKQRLEKLNLLPLMYHYELQDIMFLIKSLLKTVTSMVTSILQAVTPGLEQIRS